MIKHLILHFGAEYSRMKPKLFTWVFIGCDVLSIVVQSIGGVMAAAADTMEKAERGNNIVIAGIAIQVVTMVFCGLLGVDYIFRYRRGTKGARASEGKTKRWSMSRPDVFCLTSELAFIFILIRCIYRLPEMASGWGGELMRNEVEFMVLDGV